MYRITKTFGFSASHVLAGVPAGHPCGRLHGHNYRVGIVLSGESLDSYGFVLDYRALDSFKRYLDETFDHRHLNDVIEFDPTAENLAEFLWSRAGAMFGTRLVEAVRVSETDSTWAEYRPPVGVRWPF